MHFPVWYYDEFRQVGTDFENGDQVATYDAKQGSDPEQEDALIERLGISQGTIVVDLGCGTGSFALAAARHKAVVHAVDVSTPMLDYARRKARDQGLTGIEFHHAGFLSFSPEHESVDFVVSRFALHHLPDFWKQVALLRLAHMLRRSGVLFLRDVAFSFPPKDYERAIGAWLDRMPRVSRYRREEFETHIREEHSTFAWVIDRMLAHAGFEVVESVCWRPEYADWVCRR